jgi:hypothetical protein
MCRQGAAPSEVTEHGHDPDGRPGWASTANRVIAPGNNYEINAQPAATPD